MKLNSFAGIGLIGGISFVFLALGALGGCSAIEVGLGLRMRLDKGGGVGDTLSRSWIGPG